MAETENDKLAAKSGIDKPLKTALKAHEAEVGAWKCNVDESRPQGINPSPAESVPFVLNSGGK